MKVNIEPDFRDMWGALDSDTLSILESNNLDDPKHERLPPVPIWVNGPKANILLDCHHTHKIREKHRLAIRYVKLKFDDREHAIEYAKRIQLGRRNLNDSQRALLVVELAKKIRGDGRPEKTVQTCTVSQNEAAKQANSSAPATKAQLAKQADVSERQIAKAKKVAEQGDKKTKDQVRAGAMSLHEAEKKVSQAKPPKVGSQNSDPRLWERWEDSFGKVRRLADDLHRGFPHHNNHRELVSKLNAAHATVQAWKKSSR